MIGVQHGLLVQLRLVKKIEERSRKRGERR